MNVLKTICLKKLEEVNFLKKVTFDKNKKVRCRGFLNHLIKENKKIYNIIAEIKEALRVKG